MIMVENRHAALRQVEDYYRRERKLEWERKSPPVLWLWTRKSLVTSIFRTAPSDGRALANHDSKFPPSPALGWEETQPLLVI
ncbi:MAG: hypothetical protein CMO80_09435 [Verrucomicrobiales bacterium]|nr:hypothetical protein [Verrucomicrobiales bacterium]